jgi:hypothetical protein
MVTKKSLVALFAVIALGVSAALFAGCATYPTQSLVRTKDLTYTVLGYVGREFSSYEEAVLAAQKKYSNADAVIAITKVGTNILVHDMKFALIPWTQLLGLYAIKFEERPAMSERILRFLFGGEF